MLSDIAIIVINIACIAFLIIMLTILAAATRMKGGAGWAALIIVTTTVPIYLLHLTRGMSSPENYRLAAYIACFLNVLCIPALWFFVRRQYDRSFRFTLLHSLHLVPAVISLAVFIICYSPMTLEQITESQQFMENGGEDFPTLVNDIIVATQLIIYFPLMLLYIRRRKRYLKDNFADSDYLTLQWTQSFITVFFGLFIVVFVAYAINPRTDAWLIPILNVIGMGYLVYVVVSHSTQAYLNRLQDVSADTPKLQSSATPTMNEAQMKEICERVKEYLQSSKTYINPDLSIIMLSSATGIHHRNISIAINGFLRRNFFDLVNEMRVGEAKRLLLSLENNYTIESVYPECGFRSRSAFFAAFRKFAGTTPTQWLKNSSLNKQ